MERRKFSREFKLEAVNLVRERGVSYAQAACDLDSNVNRLRRWVKEFGSERDILKKAAAYFAKEVT